MSEPHVEELIAFYALGALTPDELGQVEAHLPDCASCRTLAAEASGVAEALPFASTPVRPSASLKSTLFARVRADAAQRPVERPVAGALARMAGMFLPGLAVASLVAAIVLGGLVFALQGEVARLNASLEQQRQALALIAAPGAETRVLQGTEVAPQARGALVADPQQATALLVVSGLAPLPPNRVYQFWLIRGEQPIDAGIFTVDPNGIGQLVVLAPSPIADFQAVGLTVEPEGGSPLPTGDLVMIGTL